MAALSTPLAKAPYSVRGCHSVAKLCPGRSALDGCFVQVLFAVLKENSAGNVVDSNLNLEQ